MFSQRKTTIYAVLTAVLLSGAVHAQYASGLDLLREMHKRYYQAGCKAYSFSQRNSHYHNDSLLGHSVWHEAVEYPDKFRITIGEKSSEDYTLFRNDSVFRIRKGIVKVTRRDSNNLLLLIGGMYYRTFDDAASRLRKAGYDLQVISSQKWNGKDVYVIGGKEGDKHSNQFWVNRSDLVIIRIIEKMDSGDLMDMRFEEYKKWCKGHTETKVSFRRNGMLEQEEEYYDLKEEKGFVER